MTITQRTLENIKRAMGLFKDEPERKAVVIMRSENQCYIDCIVERGNWYYGSDVYVYWDGAHYGFSFNESVLETLFPRGRRK